jgi:hypothetical protein
MNNNILLRTKEAFCPLCNNPISKNDNIVLVSEELTLSNYQTNLNNLISGLYPYHGDCMKAAGIKYASISVREASVALWTALRHIGRTISKDDALDFCIKNPNLQIKNLIKLWLQKYN